MFTTTHPAPKHLASALMAISEEIPDISVDILTENPEDPDTFVFTWFVPESAQMAVAEAVGALLPDTVLAFEKVDDTVDYVALTRASFPPLEVGPFFIARNDEAVPEGKIGLNIVPNRAFGSGEHATTTGCLLMYLKWAETTGLKGDLTGLDYGAGSGILAIAAAKHAALQTVEFPFTCLDNDPPSVEINAENGDLNGVGHLLTCAVAEVPPTGQTFSLIFANILLQPLLELAEGLVSCLEPSPRAGLILSGFTTEQAPEIDAAYTALGLTKVAENIASGWVAQLWQRV